jgi:predicted PurR-regulated permease PerM
MWEELVGALTPESTGQRPPVFVNAPKTSVITSTFSIMTPIVDEFLIFVVALVFNLVYNRNIHDAIYSIASGSGGKSLARLVLHDVEKTVSSYFGTVTVINAFLGVATAGIAYAVDLPNPILWGVLTAVLNFIPYLGPAMVFAALFIVGAITFPTLQQALPGPALFLALTTLEGQVITPALIGHSFTINPFLVFVSVAFWAWMWGPVGAFLAVPILLTIMVMARHWQQAERLSSTSTS